MPNTADRDLECSAWHVFTCKGTGDDSPMTGSSSARVALPTAQDWLCPNGSNPELALSCKVNVRLPNLSLPSNAAGCGALHASAPHRGYHSEAAKAQEVL